MYSPRCSSRTTSRNYRSMLAFPTPRALSGRPWKRAMRANNTASICFINGNVMGLKGCSGSPLQRNSCLEVGASGRDFRGAGLGEVILILDHREICGEPDSKCLLFHLDGLLLQAARLNGRFIGRSRLA